MEALELALILLATVLLSSVVTQLVPKVSAPLVQIVLGVVVALITPQSIEIVLDPELFMVMFVAPLLYDEAKNADKAALWHYRGPVLSLAIGLVIVTVFVMGFAVHAALPLVPLAAAFALCAALSPTDPIAVASLSETAEIPKRSGSILKAESLLNDASGIVSFQFAVAAGMTGAFSLAQATGSFAVSFIGGILLGSGGLVRAYSKAASMALEAAGRARMAEWASVAVECSYALYERVRRLLEALGGAEIEGGFAEHVTVSALLPAAAAEALGARLSDLSSGAARYAELGRVFRPVKIEE